MAGGRTGGHERGCPGAGATLGALLVFLCATAPPVQGQSAATVGLGIDHFGAEQGLPGLYIPDMAVTGDGLLWLISSGRLTSFDGLTFEDQRIPGFGPDGSVVGIGAGRGDTLWVTVDDRLVSWVHGHVAETGPPRPDPPRCLAGARRQPLGLGRPGRGAPGFVGLRTRGRS